MRIVEFQTDVVSLRDVVAYLRSRFTLAQVGGRSRVYRVGNELGVVFLVNNSPRGIGLVWQQGSSAISRIYLWNKFNIDNSPDIYADIPMGSTREILKAVGDLVEKPQRGIIEAVENDPEDISVQDFIAMAKRMFNGRVDHLTADQITKVATQNNVTIPATLLSDPKFRLGTNFNLMGDRHKFLVAKISPPNVRFSFSAMDRVDDKLERDFMEETGEPATMEQQYSELRDKVALIAGNKSSYIKSLLITGSPSSGKTYTVLNTLRELGLTEGDDYIVIKGSITDSALYQTLVEQIDRLTVFDDCDSVRDSAEGKNLLKGALDTYAVRELSRVNKNSINTKQMKPEERDSIVDSISRILRGEPRGDDLTRFDQYLPKSGKKEVRKVRGQLSPHPLGEPEYMDDQERLRALQSYFSNHLPNRIDFRGRIIFISNLDENEWDSAITSRAFRQNMNFGSEDMLDYIEKIKSSIPADNLTDEEKDEVISYIRQLHDAGKIQSRINFRFVQKCLDLRLCPNWRKMIPLQ